MDKYKHENESQAHMYHQIKRAKTHTLNYTLSLFFRCS